MTRKLYIILILAFTSFLSFSQHWEAASRIAGPQNKEVSNIDTDSDGHLYVTGTFSGETYFGKDTLHAQGVNDIFLAKYNNVNDLIWVKQIKGPNVNNLLYSTIIGFDNANNIYIAGYFYREITLGSSTYKSEGGTDIFLAKYSSNGNFIWGKHEGSHKYEGAISGSVDKSGNIVVAGFFYDFTKLGSHLLFGAGNRDIFLVKYNNMGNIMWAKAEGGNAVDYITDITSGPANSIYLTGYFSEHTSFRDTTIYSRGGVDIFLAKYNPFGNLVWARQSGSIFNEYAEAISIDDDQNIHMCGYFSNLTVFDSVILYGTGDQDVFITKFNTNGNVVWANQAGSIGSDKGRSISCDRFNNCYITGYFMDDITFGDITLNNQGDKDGFLAIIDEKGEFLCAKQMSGVNNEFGHSIQIDINGKVIVTGEYQSPTIYFDTITLNSNNNYDIFTAELSTSSYVSCIADFTFIYDSADFRFEFTDHSEGEIIRWHWDFGDGDTSDLQSPTHNYDDYGAFDVCLAITTIDPFSNYYCTDTICKQVVYGKPNEYNLGGQVFAGSYPLDTGIAYLYRILSNNYVLPIDTTNFATHGYFHFYQVFEGNYIVKVDPEFHSNVFMDYIPTYYGDQAHWKNVIPIKLDHNEYSADIDLIKAQPYNSGPGRIPGNIRFLKDKPSSEEGPAVGVEILLMDVNNNIFTLTYSDQHGNFNFHNLAFGTYKVYAEIAGLLTTPIIVTLDADNPVSPDITLFITNGEIIIGLEDNLSNSISYSGNIFPNPVNDVANIEFYLSAPANIRFEIYNKLGQMLKFNNQNFGSGKYLIPLQLNDLPNGMYFLKVTADDGSSFVRKFIKANSF